jgi:hypothetical protein
MAIALPASSHATKSVCLMMLLATLHTLQDVVMHTLKVFV